MFYRFNAHKAKKTQSPQTATDRLAGKIATRIQSVQRHWASFMDKHARRLPQKWLKAVLLLVVLGSGAYCTHLISGGIFPQAATGFETLDFHRIWPFDPFGQKEKLKKQSAMGRYLDSLEREVRRDSMQNPQYYNP